MNRRNIRLVDPAMREVSDINTPLSPSHTTPFEGIPMLPTRPVLKEICDLDRSLASFPHRLSYILHGPEYDQCVLNLGDNDLAWLINYLDGVCRCVSFPHALLKLA